MEGLNSPHSEMTQSSIETMADIKTERVDFGGDWRGPGAVIHESQAEETAPTLLTHQPEYVNVDETMVKQEERSPTLHHIPRDTHVKREKSILDCGNAAEACTFVKQEEVENQQISTRLEDVIQTESGKHFKRIKLEPAVAYNGNDPSICKTDMTMLDGFGACVNSKPLLTSNLGVGNRPVPVALYRRERTPNGNTAMITDDGGRDTEKLYLTLADRQISCLSRLNNSNQNRTTYDVMYQRRDHTENQSYQCSMCDYSSTQKRYLVAHMKAHTEKNPYKCATCDYITVNHDHFAAHNRTHTGEKPFQCPICGQCFAWKSGLVGHMRRHTGEKPYKCTVCDYSSTESGGLKRHMRTHTGEKPYKCSICDYSSNQKSDLVIHIRNHTGEKPYACSVCDFRSSKQYGIVCHMRSHTGEKPYACLICHQNYQQKASLEKHMKTHST